MTGERTLVVDREEDVNMFEGTAILSVVTAREGNKEVYTAMWSLCSNLDRHIKAFTAWCKLLYIALFLGRCGVLVRWHTSGVHWAISLRQTSQLRIIFCKYYIPV